MKLILLCMVIFSVTSEINGLNELSQRSKLDNSISGKLSRNEKPSSFGKSNHNASPFSNCNCGWRNNGRIVGGKETRRNEYPWMVLVVRKGLKVGGSIITPFHVLTAAHCTVGIEPHEITIFVGRHNVLNPSEGVQHSLASIIQHKGYKPPDKKNDISVLVTKEQIEFNQNVGPVCLPTKRYDLVGKEIKVTGWGLTEEKGNKNILHEVDLLFVHMDICRHFWPGHYLKETQLCAYGHQKDSCQGDSGNPLVYLNPDNSRYSQVAVVSYGHTGCRSEVPSVNTDVFSFIDWIIAAISESKPGVKACAGN